MGNEERYCVNVVVFRGEPNEVDRDESVTVWAADKNEAAQKARESVGRRGEWVKVLRVRRKQR